MKNKQRGIAIILSFLLTMVPLQVFAADTTKELTVNASSEEEAIRQAEEEFKTTIKEDGKKYKLLDIRYEVLETKYLDTIEKKVELKEEPQKSMTENDVNYTLKSFDTEERNKEGIVEQIVTAYEDFDHAISSQDVPNMKLVTEINKATGEEEQVECLFTEITNVGTTTVDKTMTITFTDYDSAYFSWNGQLLPHNDDVPPLSGYESSLLSYVGASDGSIVTDFWWAGDPYMSNGVLCRDAATTVRQPVQMYRANYQGTIDIPKETIYQAIYEAPDENGRTEVIVKANATYVEDHFVQYVIAAGIGVVLLIVLIVLILLVLSKKREKKNKEEA